jgi:hypothetical protein
VARYAGNPQALRVVGKTVGAICGGSIAAFLAQDVAVFGEIRQLVDEQVGRVSGQERAVLGWLAAERGAVGFVELVREVGPVVGRAAVVEAVEALARRSLLAVGAGGTFILAPVVREYAASVLVERRGAAGGEGQGRGAPRLVVSGQAAAGRRPGGSPSSARGKARQVRRPYRGSGTATGREDRSMASLGRHLECLNCGQSRSFVHHTERAQRRVSQAEALALPRQAVVTCGRCGSASVLYGWGDGLPAATRRRLPLPGLLNR